MQIRPGGFRNYVFLAVCLLVLAATVSPTVGHREDKTDLADALRELAALIVDEMYEADRAVESAEIAALRIQNAELRADNEALRVELAAASLALDACRRAHLEADAVRCAVCEMQRAAAAAAQAACLERGEEPCMDNISVAVCPCPGC